ncbi:MAG: hypothetical protein SGI71_02620 [Verrucomicrobiota bacterium]|nr:hypothetical protein [Verrucomicrobiota bacterium]
MLPHHFSVLKGVTLDKGMHGLIICNDYGIALYADMPSRFNKAQLQDSAQIIALTFGHECAKNPYLCEIVFDYDLDKQMILRRFEGICNIGVICDKGIRPRDLHPYYNNLIQAFAEVQMTPTRVPPVPVPQTEKNKMSLFEQKKKETRKVLDHITAQKTASAPQHVELKRPTFSIRFSLIPKTALFPVPKKQELTPLSPDRPVPLTFFYDISKILLEVVGPTAALVVSATLKEMGFFQMKFPHSLRGEFVQRLEKHLPDDTHRELLRHRVAHLLN